jgi:hypothetical protein
MTPRTELLALPDGSVTAAATPAATATGDGP